MTLTPEQMRAAGVIVATIRSPAEAQADAAGGAGIRLTGQAVAPADSTAVILSTVSGQVESVAVQVGVSVRAGQPLARVYSAELAAMQREYLHAQEQARLARDRLDRDESLFQDGIIAGSRLNETRSSREMAVASLQEQRRVLVLAGYDNSAIDALTPQTLSTSVTIRARTDGVVLEQGAAVGQHVEPGAELFRLAPRGRLWLELNASAQQAASVNVGDAIQVAGCDSPGRVIAVGTQLHPTSQTLSVRAELPDGAACLRVNQFIEADAHGAAIPAGLVGVPASALVRNANRDFIFVREGAGFRPTAVTVVRRQGSQAWLRGEVTPGAQVASRGLAALKGAWLGFGASAPVDAP